MTWFSRKPVVPILRFQGPIGMATPMRPGLSLATVAGALERAFTLSKVPTVAISINSPGGSPVQSHLIFRRIRQLAEEHQKRVLVFCEDVAASGGYFLALAGDEIYVDPSSIIGSIGVISAGFGLDKAIGRLGIDRRVYTSGEAKSFLDPFMPENPQSVARLKAVQREVHDAFIAIVKDRRGSKLRAPDSELFSGAFWSGPKSAELGLADGIDDMRSRLRALHGAKVRMKLVAPSRGGLVGRLLGSAGTTGRFSGRPIDGRSSAAAASAVFGGQIPEGMADEVIGALEARALWARFGL